MKKDKKQEGASVPMNGSVELTPKEQQQRERDLAQHFGPKGDGGKLAKHSMVVGEKLGEVFDQRRRASWIPPSEVEQMPQWTPVLQPVVDKVIAECVKDVSAYMETEVRPEKEKVVDKLVGKVLKQLPGHDRELVEKRVWGTLHALKIDQGVSNRSLIGKMAS